MKYSVGFLALLASSLFAAGFAIRQPPKAAEPRAVEDPARSGVPVVVELFTSEGCSSCPPAEALLAKLEQQQPVANAQILALEEHVDYWNNLGWTDPFSAKQWTARQEEYAASLGNRNVYTPQMVVHGQTEGVGSREQQARQAIERARARARTEVWLTLRQPENKGREQFVVSVGKITGNQAGDAAQIWLAITEAGLHSNVTRGENAGEDLHHASVVRALDEVGVADQSKEISFSGDFSVALDSSWNRQNLRAVAFVEERKSRHILGAAAVRIEP